MNFEPVMLVEGGSRKDSRREEIRITKEDGIMVVKAQKVRDGGEILGEEINEFCRSFGKQRCEKKGKRRRGTTSEKEKGEDSGKRG